MSKIFVSHSSSNNASALAIGGWLEEVGWGDYFLDITPTRGLLPGERWQEALKAAADRCEAVLFLISPAWLASRWCQAELLLAKQLGKAIFGVVIEATPLSELPRELVSEWQLCDLTMGLARRTLTVSQEPMVPTTLVSFSEDGLSRLRSGLLRAGLDPASFPWPPKDDRHRVPYRGLKAMESQDAAMFFGRDASIVRGLDAIRGIRERGVESVFVVLGASGAGKSSFLRAGLLPRLLRDDRQFLPLPIIRPERAVVSGASGLSASFESALRAYGVARSRARIGQDLAEPSGFERLLRQVGELASGRFATSGLAPTIVISIDQGEELFGDEGKGESEQFLDLLRQVLPSGRARAAGLAQAVLAIVAIRSDSYERLQVAHQLENVSPYIFSLPPIVSAEFKAVIEGPARRHSEAGHALAIDPMLTEYLVAGATGADALPLLAFTLERLFVQHGGGGKLSREHYEAMGGMRGSIEAAVEEAFADPGRCPAVPLEKSKRELLLRAAFIPWLARLDPDTGEPKRRVANWSDFPTEALPLLERLIEQRLLVVDRRKMDGPQDRVVVEIAHEALLRQWPELTAWLKEDGEALKVLDRVQRAALEYAQHRDASSGGETWLIHSGDRLAATQALRMRSDFDRLLGDDGRSYLDACVARAERLREEEKRQQEAERRALERELEQTKVLAQTQQHRADEQAAARERQRRLTAGLAALLVLAIATAIYGWEQQRAAEVQQHIAESGELAADALNVLAEDPERSLLLAFEAASLSQSTGGDVSHKIQAVLHRALLDSRARLRLGGKETFARAVLYSPDGHVIAAGHSAGVKLWDSSTGRELPVELKDAGKVLGLAFSRDGRQLITVGRHAIVWDLDTGRRLQVLSGHTDLIWNVALSADGRRAATASMDGTARIWDLVSGQPLAILRHKKGVSGVAFDIDGKRLITGGFDGNAIVWDVANGRPIREFAAGGQLPGLALSPDASQLATVDTAAMNVRLWALGSGRELSSMDGHTGSVMAVAYSPDGRRLATASLDKTVRVWDVASRKELFVLRGHSNSVLGISFNADGNRLVSGGEDGTVIVWDVSNDAELATLRGHSGSITQVVFSPDGQWLATASEDGTARVWNAASGEEIRVFAAHQAKVLGLAFSPDGKRLATVGKDKSARLFDPETGRELQSLWGHHDAVNTVAFSRDGRQIATGSSDQTAIVWDASTGQPSATFHIAIGKVQGVDFSRDGRELAIASYNDAAALSAMTGQLWDLQSQAFLRGFKGDHVSVNQIVFSPDGINVATAGYTPPHVARIWEAASGKELLTLFGHKGGLLSVAYSPDGTRLASAGDYGSAKLWDAASGRELFDLPGLTGAVNSIAFSPDGMRIATAGTDKIVRVYAGDGNALWRLAQLRVSRALTSEECRRYLHADNCADSVSSLIVAGKALLRDGQEPAALASFRRAAQRVGDADAESAARKLLAALLITEGRERASAGELTAAIKSFRTARELEPSAIADPEREAVFRVASAKVAAASGLNARRQWAEAVDKLSEALKLDPHSERAYSSLGSAYDGMGRRDEAIAALRQLIETHPTPVNLMQLAASYRSKGDNQQAIELLLRSVEIDPESERGHRELGGVLLAAGQVDRSIEELNAAIRISPTVAAHLQKARAYEKQKQFKAAIESIDAAKRVNRNSALPYIRAGLLYHDLHDFEAAYRQFRRAATLEADDLTNQANFAEACLTAGHFDEAARIANRVLQTASDETFPDDDRLAVGFVLVAALQLQGKRAEARSAQSELAEHMKPRSDKASWDFGATRFFLGQYSMTAADRTSLLKLLAKVENSAYVSRAAQTASK